MATNKLITVTTIPTKTGDTIASYNAYSSIDGLLGAMTPAEAAAGKTFALSDGSSHDITVKAVWTTAGESTTNVSNIVVIDLTVTNYLLRIADADNFNIRDNTSGYTSVDISLFKFSITFNPLDLISIRYIFEAGLLSNVTYGVWQLRINTDGTLRLTCAEPNGVNSQIFTTTTAITAGVDNTISLIDGVLTVNGVDQGLDMTGWSDVLIQDGGNDSSTNLFSLKLDGTAGILGDIKALNYFGTDAVIDVSGITLAPAGRTMIKAGTELTVAY